MQSDDLINCGSSRAFNKFCGLAYMSVSKKGIAWLIVPFNYANDWRSVDLYGYHIQTFYFVLDDTRERPLLGTGCRQIFTILKRLSIFLSVLG